MPSDVAPSFMTGSCCFHSFAMDPLDVLRRALCTYPSQLLEKMAANHAIKRVASPDEAAAPIVFLASDAASFITGAILNVDGGALLGYWCAGLFWHPGQRPRNRPDWQHGRTCSGLHAHTCDTWRQSVLEASLSAEWSDQEGTVRCAGFNESSIF